MKKLGTDELYAYAGRLLSLRPLTISELRDKLARRAVEPGDLPGVMARLKQAGYLDDRKFAESFASARRDSRGFGKSRVLRDLMARRVAPSLARAAANQAYAGADETAMIESYLERKFRNRDLGRLLQEPKQLAAAFRRLRGAGFSAGNSIRVLKRYSAEAERLEDVESEDSTAP